VKRTLALLLISSALAVTAFAQALPNPTQQSIDPVRGPIPIFRVTVVGRTTAAINYRPRRGDTTVDMVGTALLPSARGSAKVAGEQGYMKIEARFEKLDPASRFGREYLTYVLWAITPEGRATNLGEIQVDDMEAKVEVTTELQAFGLIVTAEPYFAVTQPSDVVVIENMVRPETKGSVEIIEAKYELLTRGAYLMNQEAARLTVTPLEPGSPMDLAQARNAVALARLAGADRFATDTFDKAVGLLATAEEARTARRGGNAIMMPARQAAQTAEDARIVGLKRQEEAYQTERQAASLAREQDALTRASDEAARRRNAEDASQAATAGRIAAERATSAAADARLAAERDARTADAARLQAERDARVAAEGQLSAERARATDAEAARVTTEAARLQADAARVAAEAKAQSDLRGAAAQAEQDKAVLREQLRAQLNVILGTRETARGLIVNLSDVLFDTGRADLKPGAREKLAQISGILALHQELHLEVEGHTDAVGTDSANQGLSERRAESVRGYLVEHGIASASIGAIGLGETTPIATNGTAIGRQQNRRVEIIVSGASIGTL
jgi:outer membrane protein OmpA-like peptidoglycan-associated protein